METIGGDLESYLMIVLAFIELFRRIAQKMKGKKDDEISSKAEKYVRRALDFLAGLHGEPGDNGAVKPAEKPVANKVL